MGVIISLSLCTVGCIDETYVTAAEHIAVTPLYSIRSAYHTAVDSGFGLTEYITVGITLTYLVQVVVTFTAGKHVMQHISVIHLHQGLAGLENVNHFIAGIAVVTASYGGYLTAAVQAVADPSAIHLDKRVIHTAVIHITSAECIAAVLQTAGTVAVPGLVIQFLLIAFIEHGTWIIGIGSIIIVGAMIGVSYVTVVDGQMGLAEYGTTLTAAVGVTFHGGHTLEETVFTACYQTASLSLLFKDTYRYIRNSGYVLKDRSASNLCTVKTGIAYIAFPAAAIDVTDSTALNESICRGFECSTVQVPYATVCTAGIKVLDHTSSVQAYIGRTAHDSLVTQTAAVCVRAAQAALVHIAAYFTTFIYIYGGVIRNYFFTYGDLSYNGIFKTIVRISSQTEVQGSILSCLPCINSLLVEDLTVVTAAIYLINAGTVIQVHLSIL